jgi:ATP-dependent Clp protease ATP-binding subunit ClpA
MSHRIVRPEVEEALRLAMLEASRRNHEMAGLEHLLLGLLHDDDTREGFEACGVDVMKLARRLSAGAAMADAGTAITLDLSGLTFVDARGAHMLRSLGERGARLMGGSKYVATLVAGSTP